MINVLHLGVGNLYGGIETFLVTLARHQQEQASRIRQEFSVCFDGRLANELEGAGAVVHRLGPVRASRPWLVLSARRRLRAVLAERRIDVAICHSGWTLATLWPALGATRKIFWAHNDWQVTDWRQRWAMRRRPELIVANSRFTAASLRSAFAHARVEVIHCPVDPGPRLPSGSRVRLRRELNTRQDATVIIQVSRMEAWKGHVEHLHALAKLKDVPNWVCWFVGGALREAELAYVCGLRQLAGQLGIADRVVFAGGRSDVPELLAAADVFCQPNRKPEPFGIVFAEALYCGLPVITTAAGGAVDLIDESCGILIPPGDDRALCDALRALIQDPSGRLRLGAAGPARAHAVTGPAQQISLLADIVDPGSVNRPAAVGAAA